eukprot:jgi/Phyca11/510823/fgenesh2_kg.PHYCAscaffold_67_\
MVNGDEEGAAKVGSKRVEEEAVDSLVEEAVAQVWTVQVGAGAAASFRPVTCSIPLLLGSVTPVYGPKQLVKVFGS